MRVLSVSEIEELLRIGLLKISEQSGEPVVNDCSRWGIEFHPNGVTPHTEWDVAVHEVGHAVAALAVRLEFDCIEHTFENPIKGGIRLKEISQNDFKNRDEMWTHAWKKLCCLTGGPIATSILRHGHPRSWEECGNDVLELWSSESYFRIEEIIEDGVKGVQGNWKNVLALAEALQKRRKLTYAECLEISDKVD
jgi:hypothetical protein